MNAISDQHEQLRTFCEALDERALWAPEAIAGNSEESRLAAKHALPGKTTDEYEILARRYRNNGTPALKVNIWAKDGGHAAYLGAIGYHNPEAPAYYRAAQGGYVEEQLYAILGAAAVEA